MYSNLFSFFFIYLVLTWWTDEITQRTPFIQGKIVSAYTAESEWMKNIEINKCDNLECSRSDAQFIRKLWTCRHYRCQKAFTCEKWRKNTRNLLHSFVGLFISFFFILPVPQLGTGTHIHTHTYTYEWVYFGHYNAFSL